MEALCWAGGPSAQGGAWEAAKSLGGPEAQLGVDAPLGQFTSAPGEVRQPCSARWTLTEEGSTLLFRVSAKRPRAPYPP